MNVLSHKVVAYIAGIFRSLSARTFLFSHRAVQIDRRIRRPERAHQPSLAGGGTGIFSQIRVTGSNRFICAARRLWLRAPHPGTFSSGRSGGSATLAAIGAGHDFKIVATFSSRHTCDFIARPNIKRAEDLRGKRSR